MELTRIAQAAFLVAVTATVGSFYFARHIDAAWWYAFGVASSLRCCSYLGSAIPIEALPVPGATSTAGPVILRAALPATNTATILAITADRTMIELIPSNYRLERVVIDEVLTVPSQLIGVVVPRPAQAHR